MCCLQERPAHEPSCASLQLYGQARCSGPCAVFSAEVGTHSVDVFIKPAPSFVDQARPRVLDYDI